MKRANVPNGAFAANAFDSVSVIVLRLSCMSLAIQGTANERQLTCAADSP